MCAMSYFGNTNMSSSYKPKTKTGIASQKKWYSTKDLREDSGTPAKFQSQTKRSNRKNNLDTRSLWYDFNEEDAPEVGFALRRAASSGNLVNEDSRNYKGLTKDMISLPLCPRKIIGEWASRTNSRMFERSFDITEIQEESAVICLPREHQDDYEASDDKVGESDQVNEVVSDKNNVGSDDSSTHSVTNETENEEVSQETLVTENQASANVSQLIDESDVPTMTFRFQKSVHSERLKRHEKGVARWKFVENTDDKSVGVKTLERNKKKSRTKADISGPSDLRLIGENEASNLVGMKFLSKSTDVHFMREDLSNLGDENEVIKNLQSNLDDPISRNVGPFPKPEDLKFNTDEIQIRQHSISNRNRQSKTLDFESRRRSPKTQDFKIVGCTRVHLPNEQTSLKLKKNEEYIHYQSNVLYKVDNSNTQLPLKFGVTFKSARVLSKKEVELRDSLNQPYQFVFDSSKDAKNFTENDKLASLFEKSTITKALLRLLGKRSSREVLEKKGIYQNETIFGNTLSYIYKLEQGVPRFILKAIELIERPDNITSLGLYRTSGNLATIQKIRFEVDKGNPGILENFAKDPDVLTGSLKLFFRELKEPLMSCQTCDNLSSLARNDKNYSKKNKDKLRTILKHLPEANSETLLVLVKHLIEVVKYKEQNKMDTYNLAVCWGPTVIFATDNSGTSKDLVTQSTEATRLFDALLTFYIDNPEELEVRRRTRLDSNMNAIRRHDSRDSLGSSDSNSLKWQKKTPSNLSIEVIDEGLRKAVELIENVIKTTGLYKKSGSLERTNKIVKKMAKKKIAEMEKYKNDVYELTDSLKKYMKEVHEPLVTKEVVDHIIKICDNTRYLDDSTKHMVSSIVMDLPKRHSLIFIVKHLIKVIKNEPSHNVPKTEIISIWSSVLNEHHDHRPILDSEETFSNFLAILVEVFDDQRSDPVTPTKGISEGLLNDLRNVQRDKDRVSRYDNVSDEEVMEKTDVHTKL